MPANPRESRGGPPAASAPNPRVGTILAADLGATQSRVAITDLAAVRFALIDRVGIIGAAVMAIETTLAPAAGPAPTPRLRPRHCNACRTRAAAVRDRDVTRQLRFVPLHEIAPGLDNDDSMELGS